LSQSATRPQSATGRDLETGATFSKGWPTATGGVPVVLQRWPRSMQLLGSRPTRGLSPSLWRGEGTTSTRRIPPQSTELREQQRKERKRERPSVSAPTIAHCDLQLAPTRMKSKYRRSKCSSFVPDLLRCAVPSPQAGFGQQRIEMAKPRPLTCHTLPSNHRG
jgi:hypothetical protein